MSVCLTECIGVCRCVDVDVLIESEMFQFNYSKHTVALLGLQRVLCFLQHEKGIHQQKEQGGKDSYLKGVGIA